MVYAKSLYRSPEGSHFYGTEYEIWADFGPVGNTEKKNWADYEQLLRPFFSCFRGQKNHCILFNFFLAKNRLNIHNQFCIALLYTSLGNFYIMTQVHTLISRPLLDDMLA